MINDLLSSLIADGKQGKNTPKTIGGTTFVKVDWVKHTTTIKSIDTSLNSIEKMMKENQRKSEDDRKKLNQGAKTKERDTLLDKMLSKGTEKKDEKDKGLLDGILDIGKKLIPMIGPAITGALSGLGNIIGGAVSNVLKGAGALAPQAAAAAPIVGGFAATVGAGVVGGAEGGKAVRSGLSNLVGGEGKTKAGTNYSYEDIVDLKNKQEAFATRNGVRGEGIDSELKKYDALLDRMKQTKSLNDQLYEQKQKLEKSKNENISDPMWQTTVDSYKKNIATLEKNLAQSKEMQEKSFKSLNVSESDLADVSKKREDAASKTPWRRALNSIGNVFSGETQKKQTGGHITVPGHSTGDKHDYLLPPGSFVMNRNAAQMFQGGGSVAPVKVESGEKIFAPGAWGPEHHLLNALIPRFQEGGEVATKGRDSVKGTYQEGGLASYHPHFHIQRKDLGPWDRSSLDSWVKVDGKPLSSGVTDPGQNMHYGAPRDGGTRKHKGIDIAFGSGGKGSLTSSMLSLVGDAKWTYNSPTQSVGDITGFKTPIGDFEIMHGKFKGNGLPSSGNSTDPGGGGQNFDSSIASQQSPIQSILGALGGMFGGLGKVGEAVTGVLSNFIGQIPQEFSGLLSGIFGGLGIQPAQATGSGQATTEGGGGGPAGNFAPSGIQKDVYEYLTKTKGLDDNQALGLMANINRESSFRPSVREKGGTGHGLFQWSHERIAPMKKAIPDWETNWKGQIDYALNEPENLSLVAPGAYQRQKFKSSQEAADWWMKKWERPLDTTSGSQSHARYLSSVPKKEFKMEEKKPEVAQAKQMGGEITDVKKSMGSIMASNQTKNSRDRIDESLLAYQERKQVGGVSGISSTPSMKFRESTASLINEIASAANVNTQPIIINQSGGGHNTVIPDNGMQPAAPSLPTGPSSIQAAEYFYRLSLGANIG
jgi:hypothetical protein